MGAAVLCSSCFIPPREGPPPEPQPWSLREFPGGRLVSGFGTFELDMGALTEGSTTAHGGGFGDWSGGDTHFVGRKNARYRFSVKGDRELREQWLTYEIRELNQCAGRSTPESEWDVISSTGLVSNTRVDVHPAYGAVRRFDRVISDYKLTAGRDAAAAKTGQSRLVPNERLEAGALFSFQDRVYSLVVFDVFTRDGLTPAARDQKLEFLRTRRERFLKAIKIERGDRDMCQVINTATMFSRNAEAVDKALPCSINPYKGSWPSSCTPARQ